MVANRLRPGRLAQYLVGESAQTLHMSVAEDFHLEAGGTGHRSALFDFVVSCAAAGVPLSWNKTAGEDIVCWVGFELVPRTYLLGTSQRFSK